MKLFLLAISLLVVGCLPNPYDQCVGRTGDDMLLCLAHANAVMESRRDTGNFLRVWGMQQQALQAQQQQQQQNLLMPRPPITCQQFGTIVQCR